MLRNRRFDTLAGMDRTLKTLACAGTIFGLLALLYPAPVLAQSDAPARGKDISKNEYIDRAKERAAKRFDKLDANHDGVLSAEERRAGRSKRKAAAPQQQ